MTINIALATYDGIILGCDSLSSMTETAIFPFKKGVGFALDANGDVMCDGDGNPLVACKLGHYVDVATTVFGGVSKMFCLYEDADNIVAAVTAGVAILGGVTIAEQAKRYRRANVQSGKTFSSVEEVARDFSQFITALWEADFAKSGLPPTQRALFPTVQFILAGFGAIDKYGKVFRLDIQATLLQEQFPDDDHAGICWGGMADHVERLIMGLDGSLKFTVGRELAGAMARQRQATVTDISRALVKAGVALPDDLELQITEAQPPTLPWDVVQTDIDYGNLSTQYAVDLVELLVNTQSGMQRFARGIPTVGGRTHIGVLKRGERFQPLNEATLQHKHTGYADEY